MSAKVSGLHSIRHGKKKEQDLILEELVFLVRGSQENKHENKIIISDHAVCHEEG